MRPFNDDRRFPPQDLENPQLTLKAETVNRETKYSAEVKLAPHTFVYETDEYGNSDMEKSAPYQFIDVEDITTRAMIDFSIPFEVSLSEKRSNLPDMVTRHMRSFAPEIYFMAQTEFVDDADKEWYMTTQYDPYRGSNQYSFQPVVTKLVEKGDNKSQHVLSFKERELVNDENFFSSPRSALQIIRGGVAQLGAN